ncbi:hypothetical protein DPEC_G00116830 [Dallia pectoralis]|uniref:Uncharacterized protein n=1 Tax=Dallia pectoralis TaxID=75939 RepID=A0ACC2GUY8_DALPE|nr:hypothetical protein DPEC_G00116830 [Dallia pectoralis]
MMTMEEPGCFISEHHGFYGTIKNSTKDFIVTEIDLHGQMVTKLTTSASLSSNVTEACPRVNKSDNKKIISPIRSLKLEKCPLDRKDRDYIDSEACQNGDSFDLRFILGQVVNEQLERFIIVLREASSKLAHEELSLGLFPDKQQRANVHRAVRHNFPFLLTLTNRSEISVREDPDFKHLSGLVSEVESEGFFRFIDAKIPNSVFTFENDNRKEHRTSVHHFLSKRFGKLVETKSFSDHENKTAITVRLREKTKKRSAHDGSEEVYTAFTLKKENLETLEAISYLAAVLGVLPSDFTYAGIKDKRAITYQSMVVKKITPQQLEEKAGEFEKKGMVLSSIRSVSEPLHLGRLQGNHFDLLIRDLRPHHPGQTDLDSLVGEAVENVKARGFVNYYGPQRFGTGQSVQSDRVGLALLKEDMVTAVQLFFTPEEGDDPPSVAKRHFLQTDSAKEALALMPTSKARERLMLRALHRYGTGPDGCSQAWLSLPHNMRVFYPHAYCSRIWNDAVTHRLTTLGHNAREGDLVWEKNGRRAEAETEEGTEAGSEKPCPPQIHVVTATEEEGRDYSLAEVVLPMPGNSVKYPENAIGTWYRERLARDGLQSCRFRVSPLKLNLPGCYRHLLALPRNLSYRLEMLGREESHQETDQR